MPKVLKRRNKCNHRVHENCPYLTGEGLPTFTKPLGLDFIITDEGEPVLVELQHGFGRRGLLRLFPAANKLYRRRLRSLLRELGTCFEIQSGLRAVCSDKIQTYKYFSKYQPPSLPYRAWSPKVERWLDGLDGEVILSKPPTESCGKGIRLFNRQKFRDSAGAIRLQSPVLLQEYAVSRSLYDDSGRPHIGCIRHIVLMVSDGRELSFIHLPSYWRVSPEPKLWSPESPDRNALTANISRGAFPVAVSDEDEETVREVTEQICDDLLRVIVGLPEIARGTSRIISAEGTLPETVMAHSEGI